MVYFAKSKKTDNIKIGFSNNPEKRVADLRAELLSYVPGSVALEKKLHKKFSEWGLGQEWFSPSEELLNFIEFTKELKEPPIKIRGACLPKMMKIFEKLGKNIKAARLRRKISTVTMADRAGIGRMTLRALEKGDPGVTLRVLGKVLFSLGLEEDLLLIAKDEELIQKYITINSM